MHSIKQNLEILLAAVEAQPEDQFNLDVFKEEKSCGTLFCTAGLAASMPYFQKLGMTLVKDGGWFGSSWEVYYEGVNIMDGSAINEIFGEDAWYRLFRAAGDGDWDAELGYNWWDGAANELTHKELAILRIWEQIGQYSDE